MLRALNKRLNRNRDPDWPFGSSAVAVLVLAVVIPAEWVGEKREKIHRWVSRRLYYAMINSEKK